MSAQQVTEGDSQTTLSNNTFTKTGYTFSSWNTEADGSGTTYESTALASNVYNGTTLYAQWKPNTYTISFDAKDGQGTMNSMTATYDKPAILPPVHTLSRDITLQAGQLIRTEQVCNTLTAIN